MKRILTLAAAAFFGLSGVAHAALLDVSLGDGSTFTFSNSSGSLAPNVDLGSIPSSDLILDGNSQIVSGSVSGQYAQPTGGIFGGKYLAVLGGSSATFTNGGGGLGLSSFGFTWGSIDDYNTLTLTDSRGVSYTITGADILGAIAGSVTGTTQADVSFSDSFGNIVNAVLSSTSNSFEVANFEKSSAVPLPPALPLFTMALMAIGFVAYRRKTSKA